MADKGPPNTRANRPTAWVIGGARRLGRAIALEFAASGCDILMTYNTSKSEAQETVALCRSRGAAAQAHPLALEHPSTIDSHIATLADSAPHCDILVLSASAYHQTPCVSLSASELASMFAVNAASHVLIAKALAPRLAASPLPSGGAIIALLDIHAMGTPRKHHLAYAMSKAALTEAVRSLAIELAPGVRVNGIGIGVAAWPESGPDSDRAMQERYLSRVPLARAGNPDEVAKAARFLALEATYTTGHILTLDGGRSLT